MRLQFLGSDRDKQSALRLERQNSYVSCTVNWTFGHHCHLLHTGASVPQQGAAQSVCSAFLSLPCMKSQHGRMMWVLSFNRVYLLGREYKQTWERVCPSEPGAVNPLHHVTDTNINPQKPWLLCKSVCIDKGISILINHWYIFHAFVFRSNSDSSTLIHVGTNWSWLAWFWPLVN